MREIDEAKRINEYLDLQEHNFQGKPIFRLTWANDQFEMREGTYNEFRGDLFVRTVYGVKKTPKYPYFKDIWVLEQYFGPERCATEQIKDHNGYECIYAFRDAKGNWLPLNLRVVELIMKAKKEFRKSQMLSKSILQALIDEKEKKNYELDLDMIDPSSPIESALHFKEGVSLKNLEIPGAEKQHA